MRGLSEGDAAAQGARMSLWIIFAFALALALVLSVGQGSVRAQTASSEDSAGDADDDGDVDGEILVKFEPGTSEAKKRQVVANKGDRVKENLRKPGSRIAPDVQVVGVDGDEKRKAESYEDDPNVEYAEPNFIYQPSATTPADPDFSRLYGLHNTGQLIGSTAGTADADIDAPEAWDVTTGASDTVVAVIDSGVDTSHPDLKNNIWTNPGESGTDASGRDKKTNSVDDDGNSYVDDANGWDFFRNDRTVYDADDGDEHGTHVAGTIAAEGTSQGASGAVGVVGVNWDAQVMPLKFLGPNGGSTSNAVKALDYAVAKGAGISNNSWGGGGFSQTLKDALSRADAAGHLFVAAAGNNGTNNDTSTHYPASYDNPNVVAVAATDKNDALASFSNYGANSVDLAAPGASIYSTLPNNTYGSYSGTSMATPHVAGVAALIKSEYPSDDDEKVKARLLDFVNKKSNLSGKTATGGRLNAAGALSTTTITSGPSGPVSSTSATFEFSSSRNGATFQCRLDNGAWSTCTSGTSYSGLSAGSHTFQVKAVDAAGNAIDHMPTSRTWKVDLTAPTVGSPSPTSGATNVRRTINVTAVFSEAMNQSTVVTDSALRRSTTVTLLNTKTGKTVDATVTYDAAARKVTLDPYGSSTTNLDPRTKYTVTVDGAKDLAGNPNTRYSWSFTTRS